MHVCILEMKEKGINNVVKSNNSVEGVMYAGICIYILLYKMIYKCVMRSLHEILIS